MRVLTSCSVWGFCLSSWLASEGASSASSSNNPGAKDSDRTSQALPRSPCIRAVTRQQHSCLEIHSLQGVTENGSGGFRIALTEERAFLSAPRQIPAHWLKLDKFLPSLLTEDYDVTAAPPSAP
ncbi:unnamed protein product [Gulo gulo]|uniref:Uncharacterized protein n=1 Tax=Gulo gulo TaxID=48420 RepID=A0A9X9M0N6_GULGU|nr:unnamed protein product [Gulo gulo]